MGKKSLQIMDCFKKIFGKEQAKVIPIKKPEDAPAVRHKDLVYLYYQCEVRAERLKEVLYICDKIKRSQSRYEAIEKEVGVPWYAIGAIHHKEASLDFRAYLGNGELIIGTGKKSTIVPIGHGPFATFEAGAIDALKDQRRDSWSLGDLLHFLEGYNGFGYRSKGVNTPYLFAATTVYEKGGFPRDHFYDPNHVVKNPGCVAIFRGLGLFAKS